MNRRRIGYRSALFVLTAAIGLGPFVAAQAFEVTDQQREACEPDAFRLCSNEIPDIPRVTACMTAKRSQLSPACRAVFNSMDTAGASKPQMHAEHAERIEHKAHWKKKEAARRHREDYEEAEWHRHRAHHREVLARRYRHHYYADYDR